MKIRATEHHAAGYTDPRAIRGSYPDDHSRWFPWLWLAQLAEVIRRGWDVPLWVRHPTRLEDAGPRSPAHPATADRAED